MTDRYEQFRAANDERTCLGVMMKLRQGGTAGKCPACGRRSAFEPNVKHRAYTCASCGHSVYPCEGTPLEALRTPLALWFYAIKALVEAGPDQVARRLERDAGVPRTAARRMERELGEVAGEARSLWPDWLVAVGALVTAAPGQAAAPDPASPAPSVNPTQVAPPVAPTARAVPPVRAFSSLGHPPLTRQPGPATAGSAHGPAAKADASAKPRQVAKADHPTQPADAAGAEPAGKSSSRGKLSHAKPGRAGTGRAGLAPDPSIHAGPGSSAAAMPPAPAQAAPREHAYLLPIVAGALLLGLALAGGFAYFGWKAPADGHADSDAPELALAPAHPSLILSAVEEDLEAAREAVEFALENDASLGQQQPLDQPDAQPDTQGDAQSDIDLPPLPDAPRAPVTIPSVRLPMGTPLRPGPGQPSQPVQPAEPTAPRLPSGPPMVANGDPNQVLTFGPIKIRRHIVDTIVRAARVVGADPSLLMAVADKESSFATEVKAKTSSATGLYQFIESTWLGVIYEFGAKHGLKERASISRNGRQFVVNDPAERARILDLRREPYLSALLAGEMLKRDTLRLEKSLGRHLTGGEIYLIHFLGPDAAETFIDKLDEQPNLAAADLLPRPAQANRPIFYGSADGQTKTLSVAEVHRKFDDMIKVRLDRYRVVKGGPPPLASKVKPL